MKQHRYQQGAFAVPGAQPRDYSPQPLQLAGPVQGWLPLDGGALGPLFNTTATTTTTTTTTNANANR